MEGGHGILDGEHKKQPGHCEGKRPFAAAAHSCAYFLVLAAFVIGAAVVYCYARLRTALLDPLASRRTTRSVIHSGIALLFRVLEATGLLRVVEEEKTPGPPDTGGSAVIVANHPSMLDALFFLSRYPQVVCVMKGTLLSFPVVSGFARAAGYLPYHETEELWQRARAACDDGAYILIFPEGTRSPASGPGEFKRGAARIATELGLPLIPYVLEMNPIVFSRENPWWRPPAATVLLNVKRLPTLASQLPRPEEGAGQTPDDSRRESVRLTESLEVLINSSLSSRQESDAPKRGTVV
jgi:1-acyl-sn-glycerol-3-phosphate acyltransferase